MNIPEIETILKSMTICVDTREQDTDKLRQRIKDFDYPCIRSKLDYRRLFSNIYR